MGCIDPLAKHQQLAREREELTEQCQRRLKNPIKRWLFNWSLKRSQQVSRDRENWKNQAVRQVAAWRRLLLALGRALEQDGVLQDQDDIFFLEMSELQRMAGDSVEFDIPETVRQRRSEYKKNLGYNPPSIIVGRFDPKIHCEPEVNHDETCLTGLAPFTDPAWTPYFIPAAGVVMDQGGLLSHGSIIAREYGIPAVVNVRMATWLIKTGQVIRVDANQGKVFLQV